jgi:hypothetical protein
VPFSVYGSGIQENDLDTVGEKGQVAEAVHVPKTVSTVAFNVAKKGIGGDDAVNVVDEHFHPSGFFSRQLHIFLK